MALFNLNRDQQVQHEIAEHKTRTPIYNSDTPLEKIISNIGGYKWYVDYYNTMKDSNGFESTYDEDVDLPINEYTRIENMLLTVENPINTSKPEELEGSAYLDIDMIPKNGDLFTAKLMDGRLGIFILTGVEKNNYNLRDIFKISYRLNKIIDDPNDQYYVDLKAKTVRTLIYNTEYNKGSDKPLFTKEEYKLNKTAKEYMEHLIKLYNDKVIISENRFTISYRENGDLIHDPYMEDFVSKVIGVTSLDRRTTLYGMKEESKVSILDLLLKDSSKELLYTNIKMVPSSKYGTNHMLRPIMWSGINSILEITNGSIVETTSQGEPVLIPAIDTSNYIFSGDFYNILLEKSLFETTSLSTLESLVLQVVNGETYDFDTLRVLTHRLNSESRVKILYYYVPIMIFLYRYYLSKLANNYI